MSDVTLLYVTDRSRDLDLTRRYFEDVSDVTFVPATDMDSAIERLREDSVDCVVSDHHPPGIDGLAFFDRVREIAPGVPFILFPSYGSEKLAAESVERDVTAYLPKDITFAEYDLLANQVRQAVEKVEAERELERTRARFRALTDNTDFAVITIDASSTVRYANEGVADVFGYDPDDLIGESLLRLVPERLHGQHERGIERYLEIGEPSLDWSWVELPGCHQQGHEIPLGITFGVATVDGEPLFTGVIRERDGSDESTGPGVPND